MITNAVIGIIILMLSLAACTQLRYQHVGFSGGYTENQVDDFTFSVSYKAPKLPYEHTLDFSAEQHLQFFLLYRCAELTLLHQHDYFIVVDSTVPITVVEAFQMHRKYAVVRVASGGTMVGAIGRGVGLSMASSNENQTSSNDLQIATIMMFDGIKPEAETLAFDARYLMKILPAKNKLLANALAK